MATKKEYIDVQGFHNVVEALNHKCVRCGKPITEEEYERDLSFCEQCNNETLDLDNESITQR